LGVKEAELNGFLDELKDQMDSDDTGKYESDLRNGPFKRLSDLMVCEHVTKELYNGLDYPEGELKLLQDDDEDVIEDFSEESSGNAPIFEKKPMPPYEEWDEDEIFPGLSDVLTVYGDGKINVNTAPLPILKALFGEEDIALDVIVARKEAPFRSVEDLAQVSNTQNGATKYGDMIAFRSNYFRVILHLQQRRVLRKRVSLVSREGSELTTLFRGAIL
jgi:type II secretory pathway component PulK